ncbi:hypothetical protein CQA44_01215 [Helicobacter sp. MIT 14-3879]|nr:hypothetical protein CQA44_01215 [Helicobacter sp. MIT 14-3879]
MFMLLWAVFEINVIYFINIKLQYVLIHLLKYIFLSIITLIKIKLILIRGLLYYENINYRK